MVAMVASSQVRWREMLMLAVPTSLNLTILNIAGMTMIIVSIIVYALVYQILGIALGLIVLMAVTSVLSTVMTRRIVQGADVRAGEQPGS